MHQWIRLYSQRLAIGEFLKWAADAVAAYSLVFGAAVLTVKLFIPSLWPEILWLSLGVIPLACLAWLWSHRYLFSQTQTVALLDQKLGTGGLLMTLSELPDDQWQAYLPDSKEQWQSSLPRLWPVRFGKRIALPLLFAGCACFVPLRDVSPEKLQPNYVGQKTTEQLDALLEDLSKKNVMEEEEKLQLKKEIQKLAEDTRHTPLTHEKWELVDALRKRMQMRLETTSLSIQKALEATQTLSKSSDLAKSSDLGDLSLDRAQTLEKNLSDTLSKLMQNGSLADASRELQDKLNKHMKNGGLQLPEDPAERQALLDDLEEFLDKEWNQLAELQKKCNHCEGDLENFEDFDLAICPHCGDKKAKCKGGGCVAGNIPGRGGIMRGRGDAKMTWGKESDENGMKFKELVLPPGFLEDPKNQVLKVTLTAPNEQPAETAERNEQKHIDLSTGRETWNRKLRPRHRQVVQRYFESK